jgi:hypothetical protein
MSDEPDSTEPARERAEYMRAIALSRARDRRRRRTLQRVTEAWRAFWGPVRRWSFWIMLIGTIAICVYVCSPGRAWAELPCQPATVVQHAPPLPQAASRVAKRHYGSSLLGLDGSSRPSSGVARGLILTSMPPSRSGLSLWSRRRSALGSSSEIVLAAELPYQSAQPPCDRLGACHASDLCGVCAFGGITTELLARWGQRD